MEKLTGPSRSRPIVYRAVGHCIYCGRSDSELGREHIIPQGLDGGLILLKSSCSNCSDVTKTIEQYCLRKMFGLFRAQIRLQSNRHKKDKVRFHIVSPLGHKREIEPDDAPSVLLFPLLSTPSILNTGLVYKLTLIIKGHKRINIAKGRLVYSGSLVVNYHYDLITFARMLAKIAHSFAVAELGKENFSPLLLDIVLNRDCSHIGSLIGQGEQNGGKTLDSPSLHHIWLEISDDKVSPMSWKWVVVRIRLFKPWSDVTYTIVVGRATATRSILKWKGLSRLTSSEQEAFRQQYNIDPVAS
jgi:hypothetical protein